MQVSLLIAILMVAQPVEDEPYPQTWCVRNGNLLELNHLDGESLISSSKVATGEAISSLVVSPKGEKVYSWTVFEGRIHLLGAAGPIGWHSPGGGWPAYRTIPISAAHPAKSGSWCSPIVDAVRREVFRDTPTRAYSAFRPEAEFGSLFVLRNTSPFDKDGAPPTYALEQFQLSGKIDPDTGDYNENAWKWTSAQSYPSPFGAPFVLADRGNVLFLVSRSTVFRLDLEDKAKRISSWRTPPKNFAIRGVLHFADARSSFALAVNEKNQIAICSLEDRGEFKVVPATFRSADLRSAVRRLASLSSQEFSDLLR